MSLSDVKITNKKEQLNRKKWLVSDDELVELAPPYELLKIALYFSQAFNTFMKAMEKGLYPEGITLSQFITMWALTLSPDVLGTTDISRLLPIQSQSVSALISQLEGRKLVRRRHSTHDRRRVGIRLTNDGAETIRKVSPWVANVVNSTFGCLSPQERDTLTDVAKRIRDASVNWLRANPSNLEWTIQQLCERIQKIEKSRGL